MVHTDSGSTESHIQCVLCVCECGVHVCECFMHLYCTRGGDSSVFDQIVRRIL